jgi:diaminopimelate decarboxylase
MLEPGRSIVGNAGITVYTIGTIKEIPNSKTYVFINGGMADNPRPMMYQSEYTVELTQSNSDDATQSYTIAGRFCESGDILAKNIQLKSPKVGDLLIVYGTGAYNYSMASNYNRTRRPAMVIVNKGHSQLLVQRESFEDLVRLDCRLET